MQQSSEEFIELGKITGAFGIKGACICQSFTDPKALLFSCNTWKLVKVNQETCLVNLIAYRAHKQQFVVEFTEIQDRTHALAWQNSIIFIKKSKLPQLLENEYYLQDLIGFTVVNLNNKPLGAVKTFLTNGPQEVMVVADNQQELLIPFIDKHIIHNIDHKNKTIIVAWEADYR